MQASADEFWDTLKKGTGRATMLLRKDPGDADLNAALLRACLENLVHDPQCEASRVGYLRELIRITGQDDAYRAALESRLRDSEMWSVSKWDAVQMFGILCLLAHPGSRSQTFLRSFVLAAENEEVATWLVGDLVRSQGIDAMLACVRHFGPEVAGDRWLLGEMVRALEEREGAQAAGAAVKQAREGDPMFDRLMAVVEEAGRDNPTPLAAPDYAALKAEVEQGVRSYFPHVWIMDASHDDIMRAARDLTAETDETMLLAYLAIFRRHPFPGDPTSLFPLLASINKRVMRSALTVLERVSDPAIRSLAHRFIAEGQLDIGARLLRRSHGESDLALLKRLLDQPASDEDAYHDLCSAIINLIEDMAEKPDEVRIILLHIYTNGPCSTCRWKAVDLLAAMDSVPDWMAKEGRYDAEPGISERFCVQMQDEASVVVPMFDAPAATS